MSDGSQQINYLLVVPGSAYPSASAQPARLAARVQKQRRKSRLFSKIPTLSPSSTCTAFPALPLITETPIRGTFTVPSRKAAGKRPAADSSADPPPADEGSDDEYEDVESDSGEPADEPADEPDPSGRDNDNDGSSHGEGP